MLPSSLLILSIDFVHHLKQCLIFSVKFSVWKIYWYWYLWMFQVPKTPFHNFQFTQYVKEQMKLILFLRQPLTLFISWYFIDIHNIDTIIIFKPTNIILVCWVNAWVSWSYLALIHVSFDDQFMEYRGGNGSCSVGCNQFCLLHSVFSCSIMWKV